MFQNAPLFIDRLEAIQVLSKDYLPNTPQAKIITTALNDAHPDIRILAIKNLAPLAVSPDSTAIKQKLIEIVQHDKKANVRETALRTLATHFKGDEINTHIKSAINDSSYAVMGSALELFTNRNEKEGLQTAREIQKENNRHLYNVLENIYANHGDDTDALFMQKSLSVADGYDQYESVQWHGKFLLRCKNESNISSGLDMIYNVGKSNDKWYIRYAAMQQLTELSGKFDKMSGDNKPMYESMKKKADDLIADLKNNEKDENIKKILGTHGQ